MPQVSWRLDGGGFGAGPLPPVCGPWQALGLATAWGGGLELPDRPNNKAFIYVHFSLHMPARGALIERLSQDQASRITTESFVISYAGGPNPIQRTLREHTYIEIVLH